MGSYGYDLRERHALHVRDGKALEARRPELRHVREGWRAVHREGLDDLQNHVEILRARYTSGRD